MLSDRKGWSVSCNAIKNALFFGNMYLYFPFYVELLGMAFFGLKYGICWRPRLSVLAREAQQTGG